MALSLRGKVVSQDKGGADKRGPPPRGQRGGFLQERSCGTPGEGLGKWKGSCPREVEPGEDRQCGEEEGSPNRREGGDPRLPDSRPVAGMGAKDLGSPCSSLCRRA